MAPTQVINPHDQTDPEQTNVAELQATLDRLTADLTRWNQTTYCSLDGDEIDPLRQEHLEAGVYHDFPLSADVVARLRERWNNRWERVFNQRLPIANCGTAFCVAGDLAVHNGWTFVGMAGDNGSSEVIPTADVPRLLADDSVPARQVDVVAREILNVSTYDAMRLFEANNTLIDIWTIGYVLTGGRLRLPDALPAYIDPFGEDRNTPELPTARDVSDAVTVNLARRLYGWTLRLHGVSVDVARLREIVDATSADEAITRFGVRYDLLVDILHWVESQRS